MPKSKILKDYANGQCSLEILLRRALMIASDLNNDKMSTWISNELYGYPKEENNLPQYRVVGGQLEMSYVSGFHIVTKQTMAVSILPENFRNFAFYKCREGISFIEEEMNSKETIKISYPELIPYLEFPDKDYYQVSDFGLQISSVAFRRIYDRISRELINMLLKIESEVGSLDDLDVTVTKEKENKINNFISFQIDSLTSIGDNNSIKQSNLAGKEIKTDGKK